MTEILHLAAGLVIASDRRIPGLPDGPTSTPPDIVLHFGIPAPWSRIPRREIYVGEPNDRHLRPAVVVSESSDGFHFAYADQTEIWLDRTGHTIWCVWTSPATIEDAATYCTGPVLGFLLRLRGALALHASAVQVGTSALVLIGPHGAGKSTTAAALGRRGCAVITDDVLHVRPRGAEWLAEPCGNTLRLWDDGAALVLGGSVALPALTPTWDKRGLRLGTHGVQPVHEALPIGAIVCLGPRESSATAPRLATLRPSEALVQIATHSSAAHLIDDRTRAGEFRALGTIVRDTPITAAIAADEAERFDAFIDLILGWTRERIAGHQEAPCR